MIKRSSISTSIKEGMLTGIPLVFGYFPVAVAFGLLSKNTGISFIDSFLFSLMVYAGASQFMALDMIKAGIASGSIILATFLLNLRHLVMSASLSVRLKEIKKHWLLFIAFGITDEFFSVTSLTKKELNAPFLFALHGITFCSWISGTVTGYLVGEVLPLAVQNSLGISLYATFAALLMPEIKKSLPVLFLSIFSGILYAAIEYLKILPSSWSLIITIIAASAVGVIFLKDAAEEVKI